MGLITIAIASYNNARYIERCMESVCGQTFSDIEIILVDDGSTDDTLQRIEKFRSDKRLKVIQKDNGGLSSVRQRALDEATGDYICFIDADDYLERTYIEDLLAKIKKDGSDVCVCGTKFEDAEGNYLQKASITFSCKESTKPIVSSFDTLISEELSHDLHLSDTWNKMYRMDVLHRYKVRFCMPRGLNGSDTMFNHVIALHGLSYSTITNDDYIHVIYNNSAVHRKNRNLKKSFQIICRNMIEECERIDNLDVMRPLISKKWYSWQYIVLEDVYVSTNSYKSLREVVKEQKRFAKENRLDSVKISDFKGIFGKAFILSYKYFTFMLPILYRVRS